MLRARQCVPKGTGLPVDSPGPELIIAQPGNIPHSTVLCCLPQRLPRLLAICSDLTASKLSSASSHRPAPTLPFLAKPNFLQAPRTPRCGPLLLAFPPAEPLPGIPLLRFLHAFIVCVTSLFFKNQTPASLIPKSPSLKITVPSPPGHMCGACARTSTRPCGCL